jgi:hypothetical protein
MAAGVKFGRKRKLSDYRRAEAIKRRAAGETLASNGHASASAARCRWKPDNRLDQSGTADLFANRHQPSRRG